MTGFTALGVDPALPDGVTVRDEWIPMPDGVRLHTRIWSPAAPDGPVPVLLEYLPYRLDDWT
ncbi:CocE/NonD family hydrolase, partial [Curtobacterium sp. CT11-45]